MTPRYRVFDRDTPAPFPEYPFSGRARKEEARRGSSWRQVGKIKRKCAHPAGIRNGSETKGRVARERSLVGDSDKSLHNDRKKER